METTNTALWPFEVVSNEPVAQDIWRLVLQSGVAAQIAPGQFMNLQVPGDGSHILRIPLSFASAHGPSGTVEIIYAVVGEDTRRLSQKAAG